jgi:folate-binding protein YgfZ
MASDIQAELHSIQQGAAVADLHNRAFLRITGSDATRWLNGMVTNSIQALKPGEGNYSFLLNAQGRIQGDCTIYRETTAEPPSFLLATGDSQLETVSTLLDKFIIMDDVELTNAYTDEQSLLVLGQEAPALLQKLSLPAIEPLTLAHASTEHGDVFLLSAHSPSVPAFEVRGSAGVTAALKTAAQNAGAQEIGNEALEAFRILSGTPQFGTDIRDRDLPQETNQSHALHFAKGCYLGQEIVERIRSRGQVHRLFTAFQLQGELPTLPATLEANGKPAGELTSAIKVGDSIFALGYARREALDTHANLTYPAGTATPRTPGFQPTNIAEPLAASNPS